MGWFIRRGDQAEGPYEIEELVDRLRPVFLSRRVLIRSGDEGPWRRADEAPEIAAKLTSPALFVLTKLGMRGVLVLGVLAVWATIVAADRIGEWHPTFQLVTPTSDKDSPATVAPPALVPPAPVAPTEPSRGAAPLRPVEGPTAGSGGCSETAMTAAILHERGPLGAALSDSLRDLGQASARMGLGPYQHGRGWAMRASSPMCLGSFHYFMGGQEKTADFALVPGTPDRAYPMNDDASSVAATADVAYDTPRRQASMPAGLSGREMARGLAAGLQRHLTAQTINDSEIEGLMAVYTLPSDDATLVFVPQSLCSEEALRDFVRTRGVVRSLRAQGVRRIECHGTLLQAGPTAGIDLAVHGFSSSGRHHE